jgi:hypothetical protein
LTKTPQIPGFQKTAKEEDRNPNALLL